MTVLKVGIASRDAYRDRTLAIARGELKPVDGEPKIWFPSIDSFAKVLSEENLNLLAVIAGREPASIGDLARVTGRAPSNLSRTLRTMMKYGFVTFERRGRRLAPRVAFSEIVLDLPLPSLREAA
jgi:predicted transcriptional regulator